MFKPGELVQISKHPDNRFEDAKVTPVSLVENEKRVPNTRTFLPIKGLCLILKVVDDPLFYQPPGFGYQVLFKEQIYEVWCNYVAAL